MFSNPFDSCSYENPSSNTCFLMNFPTSLLDDEELLFDHLLHHQSPSYESMNTNNNNNNNPSSISMDSSKDPNKAGHPPGEGGGKRKRASGGGVKKQVAGPTVRRRTGKKDRHSKIYTAQGPRDRRMRLSLQIARKFFDLQDMLGFDKASKTIEWLFSKSKAAIKELTSTLPPHQRKGSLLITNNNNNNNKPKTTRVTAKPSYSNPAVRESREKARARARQRTIEKKKKKQDGVMLEINPNNNNNNNNNNSTNNVSKFGSSSTPETVDQEEFNSTLEALDFNSSVSIIEKLLGSDSSASSSSIYDECSYLGFTRNWAEDGLTMYPTYAAISGVDELQVILQQQNPKSLSPAPSSGML